MYTRGNTTMPSLTTKRRFGSTPMTLGHMASGVTSISRGDDDQAIANYTEAIRFDPTDSGLLVNRGIAYAHKGDHSNALADYNQAIQINVYDASAYNARGKVHFNREDYDQAIADYSEAIQLKPSEPEFMVERGIAYARKGEIDSAIANYNAAIWINPNIGRAYFLRGNAQSTRGYHKRAISDYIEAISLLKAQLGSDHRETLTACDALGWVYNFAGQPGRAERLLHPIVKRRAAQVGLEDPLTAKMLTNLGLSLLNQEKWSEAETILAREPDDPRGERAQ